MRVNLLRHGESASNAAPNSMALPGEQGDRLTDRGWAQARAAAPQLARLGATKILCSPMRRARETAEAISEELGLPVIVLEQLHELRELDGFGELTAEQQIEHRWSRWMAEHGDEPDHSFNGAESFNDVRRRVHLVKQILIEVGDPDVLAVTHGIFLRFFLMDSLLGEGFTAAQAERLWQIGTLNCGLTTFEYADPDPAKFPLDSWRCLTWMDRHWDPA